MEKCTRCGKCCLAAPCCLIPIGKEVYEKKDGKKIHKCKFFTFDKNLAKCRAYKLVNNGGFCTSSIKIKV